MSERLDDLCPRPHFMKPQPTAPMTPPIYPAAVYRCADPVQAGELLTGELEGYIYRRDGQPNADMLAERLATLHGAERAVITSSGMGALALAALSQLAAGDHIVVSHQLYGRSSHLFTGELSRLGVTATQVDACDADAVRRALETPSKLVVVESLTNPLLRVADLAALAEAAHTAGARLLVDNTFAGPGVCRPLDFGADLVVESLTKIINGHGDVLLGLLCGREALWQRVPIAATTWGTSPSPFDCWLAMRGLGTMALRVDRAVANAAAAARLFAQRNEVATVAYPGLELHPDYEIAQRQFGRRGGAMICFTLKGGLPAATAFIRAGRIPFSPSLGELSTTLSHPASTSHYAVEPSLREQLGIFDGTIRLSVGIESAEFVCAAIEESLAAIV